MSTFITIHDAGCDSGDSLIQFLTQKFEIIMATLEQLTNEVGLLRTQATAFQAAVDAEQQQVTDAINGLNTSIQQLQQQLTDGGTAEQRQILLDQLVGVRNDLQTAQTDLASTIPDAPPPADTNTVSNL